MKLTSKSILLSITLSGSLLAADSDFEKALAAYHAKKIESAYIHLKNALQQTPNNLAAKLLFADVLIEKQFFKEAEEELESALALGADVNLIVKPLCTSLLRRGQFSKVLRRFTDSPLSTEALKEYNLAKASAYIGLNNRAEALGLYQQLLAQYPQDLDVRLGMVSAHITNKQYAEANRLLEPIAYLAKSEGKVSRYLGSLAFEQGAFDSALMHFSQALKLDGENVLTLRGLINTHLALEQFQQANLMVDRLVKLTPTDPQAKLLQANVYRGLSRDERAEHILSELTEQLSTLDQTYMLSQPQLMLVDAMASYGQKNWEQARKKFRKYLAQVDDEVDIRAVVLLAHVYNRLDQSRLALNLLTQYEEELLQHKSYALILVGEYLKHDQHFDADNLLTQLRNLYQSDSSVMLFEAQLLSRRGQVERAIELLESANLSPNLSYKHTLAVLLNSIGKNFESLEIVNQLIAAAPTNIDYRLLLSRVQLSLGNVEDAAENTSELKRSFPQNPDVRYAYARLKFNKGDEPAAKEELLALIRDYPTNGLYRLAMAEVEYSTDQVADAIARLQGLTRNPRHQSEAYYKLAVIYLESSQWQRSLAASNQLLRLDRLDPNAIYIKAQALNQLDRSEDAEALTTKLFTLWRDDWRNLLKLSGLQRQLNMMNEARLTLEKAHSLAPNERKVLFSLIKLDIKLAKYGQALMRVAELDRTPGVSRAEIAILRGDIARAKREDAVAFGHYSQALTLEPLNAIAFMNLFRLADEPSLTLSFEQKVEQLVEQNSQKPFYRSKLAEHYMVTGKWLDAKRHYLQLITQHVPSQQLGLALNNLAVIYSSESAYKQAVQFSQQALKIMPQNSAFLDTAGWALTNSGKASEGLALLRQAYTMNASDPEVLYHLAYTLAKLGKETEARGMLHRLINLGEHRFKSQAEALAKELEG